MDWKMYKQQCLLNTFYRSLEHTKGPWWFNQIWKAATTVRSEKKLLHEVRRNFQWNQIFVFKETIRNFQRKLVEIYFNPPNCPFRPIEKYWTISNERKWRGFRRNSLFYQIVGIILWCFVIIKLYFKYVEDKIDRFCNKNQQCNGHL